MSLPCNCCRGVSVLTPLNLANRPGLSALAYRVGTYSSFFETMKARLSSTDFALPSNALPLAALTTRDASDLAIALLDAWAIVADVLTFYQERIANEGYLRTAVQQQSVMNLAALVGYSARPGVAASVFLAYTLDQSSSVTIPAGSRVQNIPGPGELPQLFETSGGLDASGAWNDLAPRLTRPQVIDEANTQIYVAGVGVNLKANDPVLIVTSPATPPTKALRVASVEVQVPQSRTKVMLFSAQNEQAAIAATSAMAKQAAQLKSDLSFVSAIELVAPLTKPPANHPANSVQLSRSVSETYQLDIDTTPALLGTFNPQVGQQLYAGMRSVKVTPSLTGEFHALRVQAAPFGHNAPLRPITNEKGAVVATEEWPLIGSLSIKISMSSPSEDEIGGGTRGLDQLLDFRGGKPTALVQIAHSGITSSAVVPVSTNTTSKDQIGEWELSVGPDSSASGVTFSFPGLNRSYDIKVDRATNSLDVTIDNSGSPIQVPLGESFMSASPGRRTLVSLAKGIVIDDEIAVAPVDPTDTRVLNLDMVYDQILPGSWVAIERLDSTVPVVTTVASVQKVSLTQYGITSRITQLTLNASWLDPKKDLMLDAVRKTTVLAQSEQLDLAEEPITDHVPANQTDQANQIELGDLYSGLQSGRWLVVQGERVDEGIPAGVTGAELVMLANVRQGVQKIPAPGGNGATQDLPGDTTHSFLQLSSPLSYQYKRDTVTVFGNVVEATHGEARKEVLGGGDGAQELQQFSLHQSPVTYVPAPNAAGTQSTLQVRVNDILWREFDTLAAAGPKDRAYITQVDATGKRTITFGNGRNGMRLPTGQANIIANYRSGMGTGGNVDSGSVSQLATRPLGVKAVVNPLPASGGAGGDTTGQVRQNGPIAVAALDRLVSVSDYGDFARSFGGIGKASSQSLSDGERQLVFVTIAGSEGAVIDKTSALYTNLVLAFQQLGDPNLPIDVEICEFMLLVISAQVMVLPGYDFDSVAPQIRTTLLDVFGFDNQELAESIPLSRVVSAIQRVSGVQYVNVQVLDSISESDTSSPNVLRAKLREIANAKIPKTTIIVPPAQQNSNGTINAAGLAFLSADVPDTLILTEITQ
jgi:predicted phage baseplate assembly protein